MQGELVINERESFVVYIAVPEKWYRDLVDIYVADYNELVYMPHIDNKGKLCLFETEGILIDQNLRNYDAIIIACTDNFETRFFWRK